MFAVGMWAEPNPDGEACPSPGASEVGTRPLLSEAEPNLKVWSTQVK